MTDQRLREILESKPPTLRGEAAQRIEARVTEKMERGAKRPGHLWAMTAAPVILVMLTLFWLLPRGGDTPELFMVNEDQLVEYLGQWEGQGGNLNEILLLDYELDSDDWSSEQQDILINELDNFSLDTI
jgi:hypothetical protein